MIAHVLVAGLQLVGLMFLRVLLILAGLVVVEDYSGDLSRQWKGITFEVNPYKNIS